MIIDYEYKQKLINALTDYFCEFPFELFLTLSFKKNITELIAQKIFKSYTRKIYKHFQDLQFAAIYVLTRAFEKRLHIHAFLISNREKTMFFGKMTNLDLRVLEGLFMEWGNAKVEKIYSNDVYDYISRKNIEFVKDNWMIEYHRRNLLFYLKDR